MAADLDSRCPGVTTHQLADAAKAHGLNAEKLRQALADGELAGRFYGTRGPWLIRCADVERWLDENTAPNPAYIEAKAPRLKKAVYAA